MTSITIDLPDSLAQRAGGAARAMDRPLEDVITAMLEGALPSLDDVPEDMRTELVGMTWWDDATLMDAADAMLPVTQQQRMAELAGKGHASDAETQELEQLRCDYGRITLRKARALALLSVRSGKRLLAESNAA
ncbi:hypothetical protein [Imhoffiella purpurea]|uniref:Uncharacterized protein n=1 Tax=Imhoffiella purpurea TaxID=1249627 RepID=W9VGK9_9GAMM|nr:hypothetical protein [Imhoffiella purpurea]EXJ15172.1 hypothetical protein D779_1726 [Imhoffiella purpurea]